MKDKLTSGRRKGIEKRRRTDGDGRAPEEQILTRKSKRQLNVSTAPKKLAITPYKYKILERSIKQSKKLDGSPASRDGPRIAKERRLPCPEYQPKGEDTIKKGASRRKIPQSKHQPWNGGPSTSGRFFFPYHPVLLISVFIFTARGEEDKGLRQYRATGDESCPEKEDW